MAQLTCPWCEAQLMVAVVDADAGECSECLTRWSFEDSLMDDELPLAA